MRYLSVCSGIEAASVAWGPLGWEPAAFIENDAFPAAVLAARFPDVPNLGDMLEVTDDELDALGPIDLLVGGTPCQSFSVAGGRGGLDDPRGRLALRFSAIAATTRPEWVVWENVPGVLSSAQGWDFAAFVRSLVVLGYRCAWRVLDAQGFGVPQRRRRVFVVGHLGGDGAREVLSLGPRGPRDLEAGQGAGQESARGAAGGAGGGVSRALNPGDSGVACFGGNRTSGPISVSPALNCNRGCHNPGDFEAGMFIVSKDTEHAVAWAENSRAEVRLEGGDGRRTGTLSGPGGKVGQGLPAIAASGKVRRLTPLECERLQGFPESRVEQTAGWTRIPWRGKGADLCPDGPRYKAIGNSMAVPVMRWIGQRIAEVAM